MLKNILNLEGSQEITASEQKTIVGSYVKETTSRCDAWNYVSIISYEDCSDYFPLEINFSSSN
ncbi:hypothetical protein [Flavobacterium sp. KJJ]|uniref:hypothetical protein n=1 Tax=Flavobacterium sp. KJJ TaxID=1270193 RepID=UPI0004932736|nr:hypothetical protein [Flavobacterium sp. KJJ]